MMVHVIGKIHNMNLSFVLVIHTHYTGTGAMRRFVEVFDDDAFECGVCERPSRD